MDRPTIRGDDGTGYGGHVTRMRACAFTDEISLDFPEAIRDCAENGLGEVQVRRVAPGVNVVELDDHDLGRLVRVVREHGIRVAGIGSPFGKPAFGNRPPDEAADHSHLPVFERALRVAEAFGAPLVRVFAVGAPATDEADFRARLPTALRWLREPVERAERAGIVLGLENEYTTLAGTCWQAREVVDAVGSAALRVCWDVASGWYIGEPIFEGYARVRGLVNDVHVRDAERDSRDPARHGPVVRLGDGHVDYAGVIRRLRADGYAGSLTLETHLYDGDPDQWPKLRAATIHGMRELRRLLFESMESDAGRSPSEIAG
jgi:sugar phosphate isomerase/epimerase